jgi:hypothetical protein
MAGQLPIPGQSSIPGRTSIPVRNRSGRTIAIAGLIVGLLATNQWLHWMGVTNGDLLSLIPGFAQAGMQANTYPDEKGFDCANQSLGAEAEMMSEEMLKSVGTALCANDHMQPASLRGTSNFYVNQQAMMNNRSKKVATLRLQQTRERGIIAERPASSMLVAAIEPGRLDTNQDLVDRIEARARRLDAIAPGGGGNDPRPIDDPRDDIRLDDDLGLIDDDNSGSGSDDDRDDDVDDDNSGHDSGDDDDHSGSSDDDDDHSGSGGGDDDDDRSGSGGDDDDRRGSDSDDRDDDSDRNDSDDRDDDRSGSGDDRDRDRDRDRDDDDDDRDNSGPGSSSHS